MTNLFMTSLFPLLLIAAGVGDALTMRISNRLNLLIVITFFPMAFAAGMPLSMFGLHLAAGLVLLVAGYFLFAVRLFGGGDAKLLAAAGLWLGYPGSLSFLTLTVLAGGGLAVAVGLWTLIRLDSEIRGSAWSRRTEFLTLDLPYGLALAVGGILAFSQSWWMSVMSH